MRIGGTQSHGREATIAACLDPLETALAVFGLTLGYGRIAPQMDDRDLRTLVTRLGHEELLPMLRGPGDPARCLDEVLTTWLPDRARPDALAPIAADTSVKLSPRFGTVLRAYAAAHDPRLATLRLIPLVLAAWVRYLMGRNDAGARIPVAPDPQRGVLRQRLAGLSLGGDNRAVAQAVPGWLSPIVGADLAAAGLADVLVADVLALAGGPGYIRARLHAVAVGEDNVP